MVMSCCAFGCTNRSGKKDVHNVLSFHRFPKDTTERKKWIVATRREKFHPRPNTVICSVHFKPEDFYPAYASGIKKLRKNVVPIFLNIFKNQKRKKRKRKRSVTPCESSQPEREENIVPSSLQEMEENEPSTSRFINLSPRNAQILPSGERTVKNKKKYKGKIQEGIMCKCQEVENFTINDDALRDHDYTLLQCRAVVF